MNPHSAIVYIANDPYARPGNLALCHECLLESLATRPTPSAAYHLALSFARPGPTQDIEQAITHVAQAMEGDPKEVRYWHLMGLLLSGAEKWQAALEILDSGADIGEAAHGDDAGDDDEATETVNADVDTLTPNPLRTPNGFGGASMHSVVDTKRNGPQSTRSPSLHPSYFSGSGSDGVDLDIPSLSLLPNSTGTIPPSSSLLGPMPDHPKPSTQEQFEFSLQLRMSQVAMIEYVEGAEAADPKWMDVFAWVAEKRGIVAQQRELSKAEVSLRYSLLVCCAHSEDISGWRPTAPAASQFSSATEQRRQRRKQWWKHLSYVYSPANPNQHTTSNTRRPLRPVHLG